MWEKSDDAGTAIDGYSIMIKMFRKVIGSTLVSMLLFTIPMASVGHAHPAMIEKMLSGEWWV